jgi:hypothetical protein
MPRACCATTLSQEGPSVVLDEQSVVGFLRTRKAFCGLKYHIHAPEKQRDHGNNCSIVCARQEAGNSRACRKSAE